MKGLTAIESTRNQLEKKVEYGEVLTEAASPSGDILVSGTDKLIGAVADNFGSILSIAEEIVSINKIHEQTEATVKILAEQRKNLLTEAEVYIKKKDADTKAMISKMEMANRLMEGYYSQRATTNITPEEFGQVIGIIMEKIN